MGLQLSVSARNARLDAIESTIGTAPLLRIYSGTKPADCAASPTGTLLCEMTLPSDWMAAASSGSKAKSGTWSDLLADDTGTAGWFGIFDSAGTTRHIQGEVTDTAGGGPMKLSSVAIVEDQPVTIVTFTLTDGNA